MRELFALVLVCLSTQACFHSEIALNRRYLLDPTMDPAKTSNLSSGVFNQTYQAHDVAASADKGTSSGTCPTCGG